MHKVSVILSIYLSYFSIFNRDNLAIYKFYNNQWPFMISQSYFFKSCYMLLIFILQLKQLFYSTILKFLLIYLNFFYTFSFFPFYLHLFSFELYLLAIFKLITIINYRSNKIYVSIFREISVLFFSFSLKIRQISKVFIYLSTSTSRLSFSLKKNTSVIFEENLIQNFKNYKFKFGEQR
ncbi:transmembrane protein, putative (macronuclear) [Tetrahymena thermophila SB210]|uniref:Transmembrane protein, putative n=1 Tax=Tetrahymena thermophila (strain SB210) TaxID=312017 RepID=W7X3E2_TETTS|nr:transmembrane protein, putative [Tetrahymena thermophila SB210]EWS71972.1 transmembrane protein, putative [Tetrahymena thermophila SB210]|eukprot:XP_012655472.1 transmembrane protein, putative [Tetrahymena thermophila SB210]